MINDHVVHPFVCPDPLLEQDNVRYIACNKHSTADEPAGIGETRDQAIKAYRSACVSTACKLAVDAKHMLELSKLAEDDQHAHTLEELAHGFAGAAMSYVRGDAEKAQFVLLLLPESLRTNHKPTPTKARS